MCDLSILTWWPSYGHMFLLFPWQNFKHRAMLEKNTPVYFVVLNASWLLAQQFFFLIFILKLACCKPGKIACFLCCPKFYILWLHQRDVWLLYLKQACDLSEDCHCMPKIMRNIQGVWICMFFSSVSVDEREWIGGLGCWCFVWIWQLVCDLWILFFIPHTLYVYIYFFKIWFVVSSAPGAVFSLKKQQNLGSETSFLCFIDLSRAPGCMSFHFLVLLAVLILF